MTSKKVLWKSGTKTTNTIFQVLVVLLVITIISIFIIGLLQAAYKMSNGSMKGVWVFLLVAGIPMLIIVLKISTYINLIITAYTIEYSISNEGIFYKWGLWKKKFAFIRYSTIKRVSIVKFKDGAFSTLYIDVKGNYNVLGIDFITGKARHCPTLEKVYNGQEAFDLIQKFRMEQQDN